VKEEIKTRLIIKKIGGGVNRKDESSYFK